jgi:hypothetical protein
MAPALSYLLAENSAALLGGYKFGYELLLVNGIVTYFGLWLVSLTAVPARLEK